MFEIEKDSEKICSLYVNEMHLVVMLMPYIEKNLEKNEKIFTVLEKDLNGELNTLLEKTSLNDGKKDVIRKINWDAKNLDDVDKLKEDIDGGIVIVNGSREYEERVNDILNKKKAKVINCIRLEDFESRASDILGKHTKILNTMGEQYISDMFKTNLRDKTMPLTK